MKVSKETLQSLQNVIDLTEQKNKTEQDAISLEKESNEISAQISEENSAYQRLLDSAREKFESNISVSKQDAKRRGLEKLSSSVPQLPLSSIQENDELRARLDLLSPTDYFLGEAKAAFGKKPALFPDWTGKTFLWMFVSLLVAAGLTAYAYAASLGAGKEKNYGELAWLVYVLCASPVVVWLIVVIAKCVKDGDWSKHTSPKLSKNAKEKIKAMKTEEEYEREI